MRHFINLVENAQRLLYHGTSVPALASIMAEGTMRPGDPDDGPRGVSLTRERGVAQGFARDVDAREADIMVINGFDRFHLPKHTLGGALLEFDWNALARDHTLQDHKWDGADSEHEERVHGEGFHIENYIVGFVVQETDLDWWIGAMHQEAADYAESDPREAELASYRAELIAALRNHPLRRV